jgi:hypothetical protein
MRGRRFKEASDSLELTLGCMWDNFGNIILIALLVTVLAREIDPNQTADHARRSSADLALQRLQQAEAALVQAKAEQADLSRQSADPLLVDRLQLLGQRQTLRQQLDSLQQLFQATQASLASNAANAGASVMGKLQRSQNELDAVRRELAEERQKTAALASQLEEKSRRVAESQGQLTVAREERVRRLRLPREHETTKQHLYVIVRYGKLYPLYFVQHQPPERNNRTLRWEEVNETVRKVEPIPQAGVDPVAQVAASAQFFSDIPADRFYLLFQVYEDSFAAFNAAKKIAVHERFEYTWQPRTTNEVLTIGGAAAPVPPPQ